ncbi:type II toxin-antitoxin system HipA family toxin [Aromatoleum toluolicum]|uniref:Type II toxin-antitoxin system HipA family toxin n=1 Tax=Aromatoleum toluolicum TaxID=90060 RepID=A0ABX1NJI0_9RHOO|nr:type II toxin-antitoxin system HipA family toxin [Aromatoleum toluolicum]NMF99411.1 type II toxin-antitoxin system HipA family toxin [Aromatoleum toluolicum]
MGRRSHARALNAWANGTLVGQWRLPARGPAEFQYEPSWTAAPEGRPLSLSLPMTPDNVPLRGESVLNYFDNLLPDSDRIRARLQTRFHTRSREAFDLLEAIGRDCVGALQVLSPDAPPANVFTIEVEPLDDAGVERMLTAAVASTNRLTAEDDEDFRISIAGAQEKTALTWHAGQWCRPLGATPTTHIFKLPLGLVGNRQADMRTSVENEWLCAQLLAEFGVPVAPSEIRHFGAQKVLVVERFDRKLASSGEYWLRLPQEDFCQATATPPHLKYEADGGPGIIDIARILHSAQSRDNDLAILLRAQLLFFLLAGTDGHAKNFSIFLLPGGRYHLTPLYDVLSAWPVTGDEPNHLDYQKLRLAMALPGKNKHYRLRDMLRRHFNETAHRCGYGPDMEAIIEDILARLPAVIDTVGSRLPADFPADVFDTIADGMRRSAKRL